ncbi:MAG: aldo/keto reductase [Lachnospiraceae bacterium]|nr:aldo/keto reductase [Lachnospiraceae bacterium]
MQYRKGCDGEDLSILAYGCMRFSKTNGRLDLEKAGQEIKEAIDLGVNYFDTAYAYSGSEALIGEIFERLGSRNQIYIADKLPHYLIKSASRLEKIFQEQLKRLRTDHIDYYLMHMLSDTETWERLKGLGIEEWIREKKESGQIRHIGFSYHGSPDMFCRLVDAYDWEFAMIQYNYLDEDTQAGKRGLHYAHEKGLPVMIMEPLRGGKLVDLLPEAAKRRIAENERGYSAAEWSFRWLWNQPEVTSVLSGMNSLDMIRENAAIASDARVNAFDDSDFALLRQVKADINHSMKVGCTGCGYCMPCPQGVDIPGAFNAWNTLYSQGKRAARLTYMQCTIFRHDPAGASQCIGCGACEQHCPQTIEIRKELKGAASDLENISYRVMKRLIKWFHIF